MPKYHTLGEYISRQSVYVLFDDTRCLYVGDTRRGRAGVASRMTQHLANAANQTIQVGRLHAEINASGKPANWYLGWRLEIYSVKECAKLTKKSLTTVKEAQEVMIEHLKPACNVKQR